MSERVLLKVAQQSFQRKESRARLVNLSGIIGSCSKVAFYPKEALGTGRLLRTQVEVLGPYALFRPELTHSLCTPEAPLGSRSNGQYGPSPRVRASQRAEGYCRRSQQQLDSIKATKINCEKRSKGTPMLWKTLDLFYLS